MSLTETAPQPVTENRTQETVYNRVFWLSFAANLSLVTANALTFRFAELVAYLGGSERVAGEIVSFSVLMALGARLILGQKLDRYGPKRLWPVMAVVFLFGASGFVFSQALWQLYVARAAFAVGLAGMFTCSIVHIQNQVPAHRRTEVVGSLGASGFLGMIIGSQAGDWIFNTFPDGITRFQILFGGAAALGVAYLVLVLVLTRGDMHDRPHETPSAFRLMFRYWPGPVVFVAIMMGMGFTLSTVFLTRFATHLGIKGIGTYFTSYCIAAFAIRIAARNWSVTVGRRRMIMLGLVGHCLGNALLPLVTKDWHLIFPSISSGFGHALLFPAVVSLGAGAFPKAYRGSGTTIVLGFTEVGAMLSAPLLGWIIDAFGFTPMFLTASGTAFVIGIAFWLTSGLRQEAKGTLQGNEIGVEEELADDEEQPTAPFPQLGRSA
jgi:MFS family permease